MHGPAGKLEMRKKYPVNFKAGHANTLIESFKMSPHLIVRSCHSQTLLWLTYGLGLEQDGHKRVWKWQFWTIKWEGAHFKALDEGVLVAALKFIGYFFRISSFLAGPCLVFMLLAFKVSPKKFLRQRQPSPSSKSKYSL